MLRIRDCGKNRLGNVKREKHRLRRRIDRYTSVYPHTPQQKHAHNHAHTRTNERNHPLLHPTARWRASARSACVCHICPRVFSVCTSSPPRMEQPYRRRKAERGEGRGRERERERERERGNRGLRRRDGREKKGGRRPPPSTPPSLLASRSIPPPPPTPFPPPTPPRKLRRKKQRQNIAQARLLPVHITLRPASLLPTATPPRTARCLLPPALCKQRTKARRQTVGARREERGRVKGGERGGGRRTGRGRQLQRTGIMLPRKGPKWMLVKKKKQRQCGSQKSTSTWFFDGTARSGCVCVCVCVVVPRGKAKIISVVKTRTPSSTV